MTTTTAPTPAPRRKPTRFELSFLVFFHAAISGAFVVAYFSGDENTYAMHQFAGYTALTALVVRLLAAWLAPLGSPLRMPRPSWTALKRWFGGLVRGDENARRMRSPLYAFMAVVMLIASVLVAASGATADFVHAAEDLHEAVAEATPTFFFAHLAIAVWLHWLKPRMQAAPATQLAGAEGSASVR